MSAEAGYITCALWSSLDDEGDPLDDPGKGDLTDEAVLTMNADVQSFLARCKEEGLDLSALEPEQIGHDFWLTRNRHGAGFWDRGLGELGDKLTEVAQAFGEVYLYVGDDGSIHHG